jgi:hypothetical protein
MHTKRLDFDLARKIAGAKPERIARVVLIWMSSKSFLSTAIRVISAL